MLDPFLPVDGLSRFPRQLCIAVDAVNMRINLSEIFLAVADNVNTQNFVK
jgi:hypothetical protein